MCALPQSNTHQEQCILKSSLTSGPKANVEADTANKQAENPNIPKTGQNIEANTTNKMASTQLIGAQTGLTQINEGIAQIQKDIAETTFTDIEATISLSAQKLQQEVFQYQNNTQVSDATKQTTIATIKQNYVNAVLQGAYTKANIQVDQAQIGKMSQDILQGWQGLNQQQQEQKVHQVLMTSQSGLADKEKNLLLTQTIIAGLSAGAKIIGTIGAAL